LHALSSILASAATIVLLLSSTGSASLYSYAQQQFTSLDKGNRYVNENCGISIDLPEGWNAEESDFIKTI
jgi:hypothetical protein